MGVLKPRIFPLTLYHGDDLARLSELEMEERVAAARAESAGRKAEASEGQSRAVLMDEEDDESAAAREYREALATHEAATAAKKAFVTEATERAVEVKVQAIGSLRFSDLLLDHPARTSLGEDGKPVVHEDDLAFAREQEARDFRPVLVDVSTFPRALAGFRDEVRQTIVSIREAPDDPPRLLSDAELNEFLDEDCDEGDLERIWTFAFYLNRGGGVPK